MMQIKNILFDLGGVLLNINYLNTIEAFKELGVIEFGDVYSQFKQDKTSELFEMGLISNDDFRDHIRTYSSVPLTNSQIDKAWNSMLLDFPPERFEMLSTLKKKFNLFLLSNTNAIHKDVFIKDINAQIYPLNFDDYFVKAYYSHEIKLKKPSIDVFKYVIKDQDLNPKETLYIDDSFQHIETAKSLSFNCIELKPGLNVEEEISFFLSRLNK
jgi:FMN phosphatase YigB (HAD superfamily)